MSRLLRASRADTRHINIVIALHPLNRPGLTLALRQTPAFRHLLSCRHPRRCPPDHSRARVVPSWSPLGVRALSLSPWDGKDCLRACLSRGSMFGPSVLETWSLTRCTVSRLQRPCSGAAVARHATPSGMVTD